jgi:hypothetical protein
MAQSYLGSNNLPLLAPLGQFGTRLAGGRDAASARYIFTRLMPAARALFPAADTPLLARRDEDGSAAEPHAFLPVVPALLLNGVAGIGTGWSTSIPPFHPARVADAVEAAIDAGWHRAPSASGAGAAGGGGGAESALAPALPSPPPFPLRPWWRGFRGAVEPAPGAAAGTVAGEWDA